MIYGKWNNITKLNNNNFTMSTLKDTGKINNSLENSNEKKFKTLRS